MSFAEIFSSYSSKVSAENRGKSIAAHPDVPGNVLYTLSSILEDEQNQRASEGFDEFDAPPQKAVSPNLDFSADSMSQVMNSLSMLDEPLVEKEAPKEAESFSDEPPPPIFDNLDEEPSHDDNIEQNPPAESGEIEGFDLGEASDEGDNSKEGAEAFDLGGFSEEKPALSEGDNDSLDEFDLFGGEDSEEGPPPDFDMSFDFGGEDAGLPDSPMLSDELGIESPEDLTNFHSQAAQILEGELSLPDFSGTELENPVNTPEIADTAVPEGDFSADSQPRFDLWNKEDTSKDTNFSHLDLNEEQLFVIREKINAIQDKTLRFELRNTILEPQYHSAHYDELISMLLINAPEAKIAEFLYAALGREDSEAVLPSYISKSPRAVFFADDVENFEHFKEDFSRTAKRISAAAFVLIALSVILWTSVAQPLRIDSLYKRGLALIREDKFTEGESLFNRAQQIAGRPNLKWHLAFGQVYESKQLVRLAEQKYKIALVIAPKDIPASQQIAAFYTNLSPPDFNSALAIFSKLVLSYPKNFSAWDFYGNIYMTKGDTLSNDIQNQNEAYFSAAGVYRDFIIKNINNTAPYYRLLDIYIKLDSIDKIKQIYTLIDQLAPKDFNIDVLSRLAGYYIDRKELAEAERIFRRIIPYIDTNVTKLAKFRKRMDEMYNINSKMISNVLGSTYYEYARYNMLSSDVPRAIRLLSNAIVFAPSNDNVYNLLGEAFLIAQGSGAARIAEAKKYFDTAAKLNPNNYKPQVNLGHIYFYYDRETVEVEEAYNKALYHYRLAQNAKPAKEKNFLLNYNSGWLEYRNANYNDALALWSDIYKDEPGNPILSYALGSVLYQMQNPRLSQVEFQKAANNYSLIMDTVGQPSLNNPRHVEVFSQMARVKNNIGVINANYASANPGQRIRYEKEALLNFYASKDAADRIRQIYNNAEYNILAITHPAIGGRTTEFDNTVPKSTTLNNKDTEFKRLILDQV